MARNALSQRQEGEVAAATNAGFNADEEIRIVLIGKTGNGKSATGNTILQRNALRAELSPCSVTSECGKARGVVNGCRLALIDTPGIYDTKYKEAEVIRKLKECISLSAPGPHAFLIVISLARFTEEEHKTVELLRLVFGEKAAAYCMVLFTHGEKLGHTTIEEYFIKSENLSVLIATCNCRYHVVSNTVLDNHQVPQLIAKIRDMLRDNGGTFYTNDMFQEAERAIKERAEQIMRASAEQKRRKEENLKAEIQGELLQIKLQLLDEEYKRKAREKAEKKNKFFETGMVVTTAEVGVAIGAAAGAVGGPLCIGLGAVVGGALGALVGLVTPAGVKALKNKCIQQ